MCRLANLPYYVFSGFLAYSFPFIGRRLGLGTDQVRQDGRNCRRHLVREAGGGPTTAFGSLMIHFVGFGLLRGARRKSASMIGLGALYWS